MVRRLLNLSVQRPAQRSGERGRKRLETRWATNGRQRRKPDPHPAAAVRYDAGGVRPRDRRDGVDRQSLGERSRRTEQARLEGHPGAGTEAWGHRGPGAPCVRGQRGVNDPAASGTCQSAPRRETTPALVARLLLAALGLGRLALTPIGGLAHVLTGLGTRRRRGAPIARRAGALVPGFRRPPSSRAWRG